MFTTIALLAAAASTYPVAVTIRQGERVIATPTLVVTEGKPATIETPGYALSLTFTRKGATGWAQVHSTVSLPRDGRLAVVASPSLSVPVGADAGIEVRQPGGETLAVTYRVEAPR